jgi:hypothetical protein
VRKEKKTVTESRRSTVLCALPMKISLDLFIFDRSKSRYAVQSVLSA